MHACEVLHAYNEKFYRGINYFRGGPNISEMFGPGVQISWGSKYHGGPNILLQTSLCQHKHVYTQIMQSDNMNAFCGMDVTASLPFLLK